MSTLKGVYHSIGVYLNRCQFSFPFKQRGNKPLYHRGRHKTRHFDATALKTPRAQHNRCATVSFPERLQQWWGPVGYVRSRGPELPLSARRLSNRINVMDIRRSAFILHAVNVGADKQIGGERARSHTLPLKPLTNIATGSSTFHVKCARARIHFFSPLNLIFAFS